jgi:hypothetical protein
MSGVKCQLTSSAKRREMLMYSFQKRNDSCKNGQKELFIAVKNM